MLELNGDVFKKVLKSVMNVHNPDLWPLLLHNLDLNSPMKTQGGGFWIVNKVDSSFHYRIAVLVCLCYVGVMTQLVTYFLQKVLSTKNLEVAFFQYWRFTQSPSQVYCCLHMSKPMLFLLLHTNDEIIMCHPLFYSLALSLYFVVLSIHICMLHYLRPHYINWVLKVCEICWKKTWNQGLCMTKVSESYQPRKWQKQFGWERNLSHNFRCTIIVIVIWSSPS